MVSSYARLFQWVKEHEDPNWKANWSDSYQKKYFVSYCFEDSIWEVEYTHSGRCPSVIYMSEPTAEKLIAAIKAGLVL